MVERIALRNMCQFSYLIPTSYFDASWVISVDFVLEIRLKGDRLILKHSVNETVVTFVPGALKCFIILWELNTVHFHVIPQLLPRTPSRMLKISKPFCFYNQDLHKVLNKHKYKWLGQIIQCKHCTLKVCITSVKRIWRKKLSRNSKRRMIFGRQTKPYL